MSGAPYFRLRQALCIRDTTFWSPITAVSAYRFLTQPSIPESSSNASGDVYHPWADTGLSEDNQRRLLLSQNSVTARFEAHKLWDEGYGGAKVKVGVFDTGIRADHPHVKNIRWAPLFCHEHSDCQTLTWVCHRVATSSLDIQPLAWLESLHARCRKSLLQGIMVVCHSPCAPHSIQAEAETEMKPRVN